MFKFFNKKEENNIEASLIGYFRIEISKLLGYEVDSKEFKDGCHTVGSKIVTMLVPILNRERQKEVYDTIYSVCQTRIDGAMGEYFILLFLRFGVISKAILDGRVKAEEATLDIIVDVLHHEIKSVIRKLKSK